MVVASKVLFQLYRPPQTYHGGYPNFPLCPLLMTCNTLTNTHIHTNLVNLDNLAGGMGGGTGWGAHLHL